MKPSLEKSLSASRWQMPGPLPEGFADSVMAGIRATRHRLPLIATPAGLCLTATVAILAAGLCSLLATKRSSDTGPPTLTEFTQPVSISPPSRP